jgi:hypothetical protein
VPNWIEQANRFAPWLVHGVAAASVDVWRERDYLAQVHGVAFGFGEMSRGRIARSLRSVSHHYQTADTATEPHVKLH